MPKLGKKATAIISIYDAANDSEGWNSSLDCCVDYVRAHSANILFHETEIDSRWKYSLGSDKWRICSAEQMAQSIALFEKYDTRAWDFVHKHPKQIPFVDTDFWGESNRLDNREDYQFFRRELGFLRKVGSKLNDNRCWTDNIAFQFPASMHQVSTKSLSRIQNLLPHAAKSIELWRTFSILKSKYKAVLSALDHVKVGMCIAEPGGTIIVANNEAQRILEPGSDIWIGKDNLIHCRSAKKQSFIRESVNKICSTSCGSASCTELFHVVKSRNQTEIAIELSPLRDSAGELAAELNGATLITLIDLSSDLDVDCSKITLAYKLSRAESDVCRLLIKGMAARDIAETRNVAPETVKSQIKTIYRKTGVNGRINLTRLAFKANPPVE